MAKQPVMGAVKTRLAREVGPVEALRFYRHAVRTVVQRLGRDPRWRTVLAITPGTACIASVWPRGIGRLAQRRGDLGTRMQALLEAPPPGRVLVVGTDIPAIQAEHIARAFRLLGSHDAVFGPAEDGGFWLVGQRRSPRALRAFDGVRWSQADTLAKTTANLEEASVGYAAHLSDVDTATDLARFKNMAARIVPPH